MRSKTLLTRFTSQKAVSPPSQHSTLPKHTTRRIVIHGGLDAATANLPATPLTRRTSFLVGRWVAQGWSAKLEAAVLHMAATGAAWVVLPQRLSLAC